MKGVPASKKVGVLWFRAMNNIITRGSQLVVREPLVVHEGLPGGKGVRSIFTQKPALTVSSLRIGLSF